MRGLWMLVLSGSLARCTQAYAPIQMMKGPAKGLVALSRSLPAKGEAPAQKLMISDQPDSLPPSMIPYFSPKLDHTITWDEMDWCLEADGHNRGDTVGVNRCNKGPNQKWSWLPNGEGNMIQLRDTKLCLNVADKQGHLSGAPIELQECGDQVTYTWMFEERSFLLSTPSQGEIISDEARHAMISLSVLAVVGFLSLSTWLWRRQRKASTELLSQGSTPLNVEQGGVSLTAPLAARHDNALMIPKLDGNTQSMVPAVMAQSPSAAENNGNSFDVGAVAKYVIAGVVQMSIFAVFLRGLDALIPAIGIVPSSIPLPAVAGIFYFFSLRSRAFNPLNNQRPELSKANSGEAKGFKDRVMPSWTPPGVVFPIMWVLIIGPLRAYSSALVFQASGFHFFNAALLSFLLHLTCGDIWNTINNTEKRYGTSVVFVSGVVLSAAFAATQYYQVLPMAGKLLGATLLWLVTASALIADTWRLNPLPNGKRAPLYPVVGESETKFAWFQGTPE